MRHVIRPATPPEVLSRPEFARMRADYAAFLKLPPARRAQTRPPGRHLPDIPGLLAAVAEPFDGLCAFCGIEPAHAVHRFRPPGHAWGEGAGEGDADPLCYGWLADAWQNLYPICAGCQPADPHYFPVSGARAAPPSWQDYLAFQQANSGLWPYPVGDAPLLIDPCATDPAEAIVQAADGRLTGTTEAGRLTIRTFDLNRPALVAARLGRPLRRPSAPKPLHRWDFAGIRIENFKAIEELELDMPPRPEGNPPRAQALLILGENAAGKSTILEAVALAMMSDAARKRVGQDPARLLLNPRYLGSTDLPVRARGRVVLRFASGARLAEVVLRLTPEGFTAARDARDLPQVFAYGAYRHYLEGLRGHGPARGVVSLFRSDSLMSNPRDWLLSLPQPRFDEVVQALRFVFGVEFESILRRDGDCLVVTLTEGIAQETPLLAVSSGFRTVLALACDVLRWLTEAPATRAMRLDEAPALILIDEVEAHLHPRWKMVIIEGLRRALPGATFLVTTHDPLCLRRAAPEEVRVMTRQRADAGTDLPVMVEALDSLPDMGALTVDQLLTADFFGLGDTDDPDSVLALDSLTGQYASGSAGLSDSAAIRRIQQRLLTDLPIGRTEVERIVQEAVETYLTERRSRRPEWRAATRDRILDLLRGL